MLHLAAKYHSLYVDETLCVACGLCVESCERDAISLFEEKAHIDFNLCNACGTCLNVCSRGAIISLEVVSSDPLPAARRADAVLRSTLVPASAASFRGMAPLTVARGVGKLVLRFASFLFDVDDRREGRGGGRPDGLPESRNAHHLERTSRGPHDHGPGRGMRRRARHRAR